MKKSIFDRGLTSMLISLDVINPIAFHIFLSSLPGLQKP